MNWNWGWGTTGFFAQNDRKQGQKMIEKRKAITNRLPHRYPFLMVDCITDIQEGQWAKDKKGRWNGMVFRR
ncbi:hypothetical protein [Paenibacillus dendritiformis]|uniref:hypothetical protein n=1 Tax=Paenibacillus dendritiformis TaxID=130049 RepID=UPI001F551C32|nr:hypothetical protein [Paenibacillus dendritiformis]